VPIDQQGGEELLGGDTLSDDDTRDLIDEARRRFADCWHVPRD
jgi:hypothetical protein